MAAVLRATPLSIIRSRVLRSSATVTTVPSLFPLVFQASDVHLRRQRSRVLRSSATVTTVPSLFPLVFQASDVHLRRQRYVRYITASVDEEASASAAANSAESGGPTLFDKIISKEIPSSIVYEDDKVLAFRDINPQAPVHVLVIPKFRDGLTQLGKAQPSHADILGLLLYAAKIVAEKEGIVDSFRVVINNGAGACQSVYHLHLHVLGGRQMKWPPG